MKYCLACKTGIFFGNFCTTCGDEGVESKTTCAECGKEIYIFEKFCAYCGLDRSHSLKHILKECNADQEEINNKSRIINN